MSISDKQLNANRENAKKSTGPKTELAKTIASGSRSVFRIPILIGMRNPTLKCRKGKSRNRKGFQPTTKKRTKKTA